jgi:hypothetical protein
MANAKAKLTKTYVDKIEPPEEGKLIVWDTEQTGFGVYVTSNNVRSWFINFRTRGGRDRRLVLGRCDRLTIDHSSHKSRRGTKDAYSGGVPGSESSHGGEYTDNPECSIASPRWVAIALVQ